MVNVGQKGGRGAWAPLNPKLATWVTMGDTNIRQHDVHCIDIKLFSLIHVYIGSPMVCDLI
jgi:hypothetical protein